MSLIRKPSELQVQTTIKALIYGQPGIGKTTLALSTPNPVLLDFDNGVHRVDSRHQCPTLQVSSYDDFLQVLNSGGLQPFNTIVIDTAGKMLDYMGAWLIKNEPKYAMSDGALTLKGYGARKGEFLRILRTISIMGKHLVFVAHEREEKEGEQKVIRPEIGGSSTSDLIKELDLVGYAQAIGKKRIISFDPCEKFYGKNTCNLPAAIELPVLIAPDGAIIGPNRLLADIFQSYQQNLQKRQGDVEKYNTLISQIEENLNMVTDIDSLNEFMGRFLTWEIMWDSKVQAGQRIAAKANQLNAKFNKQSSLYEPAA